MFINQDNGKICFEKGDIVCVLREKFADEEGVMNIWTIDEAYDPDDDHGINHYHVTSGAVISEWEIDYNKTISIKMKHKNKKR